MHLENQTRFDWRRLCGLHVTALLLCTVSLIPANAQGVSIDEQLKAITKELHAQKSQLAEQERLLKAQQAAIANQAGVIDTQRSEIARLSNSSQNAQPAAVSAMQVSQPSAAPASRQTAELNPDVTAQQASSAAPPGPVGEAPQKDEQAPQVVQSLPEGLAVLTPQGHFIVTPSVEYTNTTNDRLVYRGVVIVPGINLGEVDASTDARNILATVADVRFGITNRLELEARIPFMWSDDRATILSQGPQGSATQSIYLSDSGIGDVEFGARYQINHGLDDWPIIVANARVKTDTGMGPFDVRRDSAGIAQQVALGSGFTSLEGGFSFLKLTDPVVLFGSANYIYSMPKDINQTIGTVLVGRVDPSNSVNASMGFGFAVNSDFSFSLGYEHSYVMPQYTMLGTTRQQTTSLQVGALTLGAAYRLSPNISLNSNFEFGVTSDAPDMRAVFSFPISF